MTDTSGLTPLSAEALALIRQRLTGQPVTTDPAQLTSARVIAQMPPLPGADNPIGRAFVNAARGTLAGAKETGAPFETMLRYPGEVWQRGRAGDIPPVEEMVPWAADVAQTVTGTSSPFAVEGAAGMAGGRLRGRVSRETAATAGPGRGEPSGVGGLEEAQRTAADASGGREALAGLPQGPFTGANGAPYIPGPIGEIHQAAEDYMRGTGRDYDPIKLYHRLDETRAKRLAQAYEDMPHAPDDPKVQASYAAMIKETKDQFNALKNKGYTFEFIQPGQKDPYAASPRLAAQDFRDNKHLWVFPTESGFGSGVGDQAINMAEHPMMQQSGETIGGQPATNNDLFRAVHDVFGHFQHGFGFRAAGEENAWRSHSTMYSPEARPAMTAETRGQNSWVNYGPHGEANRTASAADTIYAPQKMGIMPDWAVKEGAADSGRINQRLPQLKGAVDEPGGNLIVDAASQAKTSPDAYAHNVNLTRGYPNMRLDQVTGTTDQVRDAFKEHVKDNLKWLYNQMPEAIRRRAQLWYDGGNAIVRGRSEQYGVPEPSVAGVYATLSPSTDWFQNVSMGNRVLHIHHNVTDVPFSPEMEKIAAADPTYAKPKYAPLMDAVRGKTYAEMPDAAHRALWMRLYDAAHHNPGYNIIAPEGHVTGPALKKGGEPAEDGLKRQSLDNIEKAISSIEANGDPAKLSPLMGGRNKVRNFYNNLLEPNAPHGDVTIDTHAVAAGLLRPLSGSSVEVYHNFGNSINTADNPLRIPNAKEDKRGGGMGLYPLYADAYREAAKELGIQPRQLQSITWEGARGLFDNKSAKVVADINQIWDNYRHGLITADQARDLVHGRAGGITPPDWHGKP